MERKKTITLVGFLSLTPVLLPILFLGAPANSAPASGSAILIKASSYSPIPHLTNRGLRNFAEKFNAQAKGAARIQLVGGPEVIPAKEMATAVKGGAIDMVYHFMGAYQGFAPELALPITSIYSPMEERKSGMYDLIAQTCKKIGLVYLGKPKSNVKQHIFTNFPVAKYQDLKGHTLVQVPSWREPFKALGISGVDLPYPEIYTAVQTGVAQGMAFLADQVVDYKLYEVFKYMIRPGVFPHNTLALLVNLKKWDTLPKNIQELMMNIMINEIEPQEHDFWGKYMAGQEKIIIDNGVKYIDLPADNAADYVNIINGATWTAIKQKIALEESAKWRKAAGLK